MGQILLGHLMNFQLSKRGFINVNVRTNINICNLGIWGLSNKSLSFYMGWKKTPHRNTPLRMNNKTELGLVILGTINKSVYFV